MDFVKPGKMPDLSSLLDVNAIRSTLVPGSWTPARSTTSSTASRSRSTSRAWSSTRRRPWRRPATRTEHHRRAEALDRPDQGRRQHAVVHGHRVRHRDRLAGHGLVRDLVLQYAALTSTTSGSPRDPVRLDPRSEGGRRVREADVHRRQRPRWARGDRQHQLRHRGNPMFDDRPGCWMYNQGSFITGFFPEDILADLDTNVGVMGFPPAPLAATTLSLGGGDLATLLQRQRQREDQVMALRDRHRQRRGQGSCFISPHTDFDLSLYPSETTKHHRRALPTRATRSCSTAPTRCPARSVPAPSGRT